MGMIAFGEWMMTGAMLLGGLVQGLSGFGMAVVAAPLLLLVDPLLLPVPMLVAGTVFNFLQVGREWKNCRWQDVGWALCGQMPGAFVGAWLLGMVSRHLATLLMAWMILAAVVASALSPAFRPRWGALLGAGLLSGVANTFSSVGGPPVALLYQHEPGPRVRATLGAYFFMGNLFSLGVLAWSGHLSGAAFIQGLWLIPGMLAGFMLSGPLRRHVDGGRLRPAILSLSLVASLWVLIRAQL